MGENGHKLWTPERHLYELPAPVRKEFSDEARGMYLELKESKGVSFIPAPEPQHHCHRIKISNNPGWYRKLYYGATFYTHISGRNSKSPPRLHRRRRMKGSFAVKRELRNCRRQRVLAALQRITKLEDIVEKTPRYGYVSYDYLMKEMIKEMLMEGESYNSSFVPRCPIVYHYFTNGTLEDFDPEDYDPETILEDAISDARDLPF